MSNANSKPAARAKDVLPPDQMRSPRGLVMDKVDVFGWVIEDKPGKFMKLNKRILSVDHDYQRDSIKWSRVNRIASKWSWAKFGVLLVALRPDETFWVFEGQHRKLAADKRSDIDELPCLVFKSTGPVQESRLFLDINSDRGPVQMIDKFKALLAQKDETAEAVERMVRSAGYKIVRGGGKFTVQCAGVLYRCMRQDDKAAAAAWTACIEMYGGEPVHDRVYNGFYVLDKHLGQHGLGSVADHRWLPIVRHLTQKAILASIVSTVEYMGKSGPKAFGEGIVRLMNKRRRTNLIPSLYLESESHAEIAE